MLGEIVKNDQRIHAVVHEPLTHGSTGERGKVLVGGTVGGGCRDDDGVAKRIVGLKNIDNTGNVGVLLTYTNINAVNGAEGGVTGGLTSTIDLGLVDDGVDGDRGLARGTVTDDQLALATTNGNHCIDGHDACGERLAHALTLDDAGSDLLNGIEGLGLDGALTVNGLTERINNAPEEFLADGDFEKTARSLDLIPLGNGGVVTEHNSSDFSLLKVQSDTEDTTWKLKHLVEHDATEAFDAGDTIADLADGSDV